MTRKTGAIPRKIEQWALGDFTPADLPGGPYLVCYRTYEKGWQFTQVKIRLDFVIVEPAAYAGIIVSLYCTCILNPNTRHSRASKYYQLWVQANGGPPKHGERMTPSVFAGYWNVEVSWGKKDGKKDGEPTIPKIERLIERVAGGGVKP